MSGDRWFHEGLTICPIRSGMCAISSFGAPGALVMRLGQLPSATPSPFRSGIGPAASAATRQPSASGGEAAEPAAPTPTVVIASRTTAESARAKLDADYAKAEVEGTRVVADIANGGRFLNVSGLDDEELAAVARGKSFTDDESLTARAELAGRMWATLEPFGDDPRAISSAVKAIYPTLSPAVRDALGWTPAMLAMGDRIISGSGGSPQSDETESLFEKLLKANRAPGGLKFDINLIARQGGSVDRTA